MNWARWCWDFNFILVPFIVAKKLIFYGFLNQIKSKLAHSNCCVKIRLIIYLYLWIKRSPSLGWLVVVGYPVPAGSVVWHHTWNMYDKYLNFWEALSRVVHKIFAIKPVMLESVESFQSMRLPVGEEQYCWAYLRIGINFILLMKMRKPGTGPALVSHASVDNCRCLTFQTSIGLVC